MTFTDPANSGPTPPEYATPEQIKSLREYAKALGDQRFPVVKHWTQGISNMVNALVGGYEGSRADQLERAGNRGLALPGSPTAAPPYAPPATPPPYAPPAAPPTMTPPPDASAVPFPAPTSPVILPGAPFQSDQFPQGFA